MVNRLKKNGGFTLVEVAIVAVMLGTVFLTSATVYVSATRLITEARRDPGRFEAFLALESITKKIALANKAIIDQSNQQLRLRLDYPVGNFGTPNGTPSDYSTDTWVKFRIINGRLYWRNDNAGSPTAEDPQVSSSDSELVPGLVLASGSGFTLVNPSGQGDSTIVNVALVAQLSNTTGATQTLNISGRALLATLAKN